MLDWLSYRFISMLVKRHLKPEQTTLITMITHAIVFRFILSVSFLWLSIIFIVLRFFLLDRGGDYQNKVCFRKMELNKDYRSSDVEEMMDRESSSTDTTFNGVWSSTRFPGAVRKKAYRFDGDGNYSENEWDLSSHICDLNGNDGKEFCWYHVELPKHDKKLALYAQYLIDVLCPPLKLQEILALCSNGPYCGYVDGALVFRLNSPGPPGSNFTLRLAARVAKNSVITVSLGRVPRLGFSYVRNTVLSEIPTIESPGSGSRYMDDKGKGRIPIEEHVLEFFLTMNHSDQEAGNPIPTNVSDLIIHIVDTHVDHVQDIVTDLEMELDSVELELDKGIIYIQDILFQVFWYHGEWIALIV